MKKLFKKVFLDVKFGLAGEGHNLSSDSSGRPQSSSSHERSTAGTRSDPTVASVSAGLAAAERVERQQQQNAVIVKPRVVSAAARSSEPAAKQQEKSPGASSGQQPHPTHHYTTSSGGSGAPTGASVAAGEAALQRMHSKDMDKPKGRPSSSRSTASSPMASLPQAMEKVLCCCNVFRQGPTCMPQIHSHKHVHTCARAHTHTHAHTCTHDRQHIYLYISHHILSILFKCTMYHIYTRIIDS